MSEMAMFRQSPFSRGRYTPREMGYWSIVEPVWDAINIYDGPEVFAQTFASAPRASGLLFAAHFCQLRNLQWRVRPILWEFNWGSRA
jgi:hypothetical protein